MGAADDIELSLSALSGLEILGEGIRSSVYALNDEIALKVYFEGVPASWSHYEARLTNLARSCGAPAPSAVRAIEIEGRAALMMERIQGESLWKRAGKVSPDELPQLGAAIAKAQLALDTAQASVALPHQWDRLHHKVLWAIRRFPELQGAIDLLGERSGHRTDRVCHGDMHLRNVLVGERGTVMVDWFDVSRGELVVAAARTLVLFDSETTAIASGPAIRAGYLNFLEPTELIDPEQLERWTTVQWVARLAEGLDEHRLPDVVEMVRRHS